MFCNSSIANSLDISVSRCEQVKPVMSDSDNSSPEPDPPATPFPSDLPLVDRHGRPRHSPEPQPEDLIQNWDSEGKF